MDFARPDISLTDRLARAGRRAVADLSAAAVPLEGVTPGRDVLVVVDMVNGFAEAGTLYSPRIRGIRGAVAEAMDAFDGCDRLLLRDAHGRDSAEFGHYPPHCVEGTAESELVPELAGRLDRGDRVFPKNSTNAMENPGFREAFKNLVLTGALRFVLTGDCTDICILQVALSMRGWLDEQDRSAVEVGVLVPAVETFDLDATNHDGDVMNLLALHLLAANGTVLYSGLA